MRSQSDINYKALLNATTSAIMGTDVTTDRPKLKGGKYLWDAEKKEFVHEDDFTGVREVRTGHRQFEPYFNVGLGKWITSKSHFKQELKKAGAEEVGTESYGSYETFSSKRWGKKVNNG